MTIELDDTVKKLKDRTIKIDLLKDSPNDDTANLFIYTDSNDNEQSYTVSSLQDVMDCLRVYLSSNLYN